MTFFYEASLQVAAVVSDGGLWHAARWPDGTWTPFADVEGQTGQMGSLVEVALAGDRYDTHLAAVNSAGALWHAIRYGDGSWTKAGDVEGQIGDIGTVVKVSLASFGGDVHLAAVDSNGGLWHTMRRPDGRWTKAGNVKGQVGDFGQVVGVAIARVDNEIHLAAITKGGSLWRCARHYDGTWSPVRSIESQAGYAPLHWGEITAISAMPDASGTFSVSAVNAAHTATEFYSPYPEGYWKTSGDWNIEYSVAQGWVPITAQYLRVARTGHGPYSPSGWPGHDHQVAIGADGVLRHRVGLGHFSDLIPSGNVVAVGITATFGP